MRSARMLGTVAGPKGGLLKIATTPRHRQGRFLLTSWLVGSGESIARSLSVPDRLSARLPAYIRWRHTVLPPEQLTKMMQV